MADNKSARVAIVFRTMDNIENKNNFDEFINFVTEQADKKTAELFQISNLETSAVEKNSNNKSELFNDNVKHSVSYTTKKPITDVEVFEKVVKVLAKWHDSLDVKPSIELIAGFIKCPIYYRNNKFTPPRTYYDLDLVNEKDQRIIDEINSLLVENDGHVSV